MARPAGYTASNPLTIAVANQKTFNHVAPVDVVVLKASKIPKVVKVTVGFDDGTADAKKTKVMQYAALWSEHAFVDFVTDVSGSPRISVTFNTGSGNYCILADDYVMINIGALTNPNDNELRRDVLHEFGHALGLKHEHQNPNSAFEWNKPSVIEWYKDNEPKMNEAEVTANILTPVATPVVATAADPDSIMAYHIPPGLTTNGKNSAPNMVLSAGDKQAIRLLYPGRPHRA